ncbi:MAG: GxxExxY protein [Verrucomicrobiota bacterium]
MSHWVIDQLKPQITQIVADFEFLMSDTQPEHLFKDLTERIIGSAMLVHRTLGPGLSEECYENALCLEFAESGIDFSQQTRFSVTYKGRPVGKLIPDLIVEDRVIVENKVVDQIVDAHVAQTLTYLTVTKPKVGLILNFKQPALKIRRVIQSEAP